MSSNHSNNTSNLMKDFLKPIESIKQVETPPFLLEKIQQKINEESLNRVSPKIVWSVAASFLILFILNIYIVLQNNPLKTEENNIAKAFQLMPDNNLYQ